MSNIFIDPYMLAIEKEEHLPNAIQFYNQIFDLCKKYTIVLYEELYKKLIQQGQIPFPINLSDVKNEDLRKKINSINTLFSEILFHNALWVDVDSCYGEQNFTVTPHIEGDEKNLLYDICMLVLRGCYEKDFEVEDQILTDSVCGILELDKAYLLRCGCSREKKFEHKLVPVEPVSLFSKKQLAIDQIRMLLETITKCQDPETIRDNHHNFVQDSEVKKFSDLTRKNKSVLKELLEFGLFKIHFVDRVRDDTRMVGSIRDCVVEQRTKVDEVKGVFYSQKGCCVKVLLYFPEGMGQALCCFTNGEFTYQNIMELHREL